MSNWLLRYEDHCGTFSVCWVILVLHNQSSKLWHGQHIKDLGVYSRAKKNKRKKHMAILPHNICGITSVIATKKMKEGWAEGGGRVNNCKFCSMKLDRKLIVIAIKQNLTDQRSCEIALTVSTWSLSPACDMILNRRGHTAHTPDAAYWRRQTRITHLRDLWT